MINSQFYCAGITRAAHYAMQHLSKAGIPLSDSPGWETGHLLLDVPSTRPGSILCDEKQLDTLLSSLPRNITIWGGNLAHPGLNRFKVVDLLKDDRYLCGNAEITAECALKLGLPLLHTSPQDSPVLIIGWGRIGKHLARLLKQYGYPVTVAARNAASRQEAAALGFNCSDICSLVPLLPCFRLVYNTVPSMILTEDISALCHNCVKIDLASCPGIAGKDVIWARGLPGIHAPEQSGILIAETILRLLKEV